MIQSKKSALQYSMKKKVTISTTTTSTATTRASTVVTNVRATTTIALKQ